MAECSEMAVTTFVNKLDISCLNIMMITFRSKYNDSKRGSFLHYSNDIYLKFEHKRLTPLRLRFYNKTLLGVHRTVSNVCDLAAAMCEKIR